MTKRRIVAIARTRTIIHSLFYFLLLANFSACRSKQANPKRLTRKEVRPRPKSQISSYNQSKFFSVILLYWSCLSVGLLSFDSRSTLIRRDRRKFFGREPDKLWHKTPGKVDSSFNPEYSPVHNFLMRSSRNRCRSAIVRQQTDR